jgi:hypothetical protein
MTHTGIGRHSGWVEAWLHICLEVTALPSLGELCCC